MYHNTQPPKISLTGYNCQYESAKLSLDSDVISLSSDSDHGHCGTDHGKNQDKNKNKNQNHDEERRRIENSPKSLVLALEECSSLRPL